MFTRSPKFALVPLGVLLVACATLFACGDDSTASSSTSASSSGAGGPGGAGGQGGAACFEAGGGYGPFADLCTGEPNDTPCLTCVRSNCCTEVTACVGDSPCECLLECFIEGCEPIGCLGTCGQSQPVNDLTQCATTNCSNECVGN